MAVAAGRSQSLPRGIGVPIAERAVTQRTAQAGFDDFALWAEGQASALRERRELLARLRQLGAHLLKVEHQPERASSAWRETVIEQAEAIEDLLEDSPSLRREMPGFIARAYPRARNVASRETSLLVATFPEAPTPEFERALGAALAGEDFEF